MGEVPDIFEKGVHNVIERVFIIGNGQAGAEHQCVGLICALGLGHACSLQRVTRPRDGFHHYLRWLPPETHVHLASLLRRYLSPLRSAVSWLPSLSLGASASGREPAEPAADVADVDPSVIANLAKREGPLLVVASGRDTWRAAAAIKQLAPSTTFVIQIQHPRTSTSHFDLVITPAHDYYNLTPEGQQENLAALPLLGRHPNLLTKLPDKLQTLILPKLEPPGNNVVQTVGALHHADAAALRSAAARWHDVLAPLPKPLVAVNVGGPTVHCQYGQDLAAELCQALTAVLSRCGGFVRLSFSRRTPPGVVEVIRRTLEPNRRIDIWSGQGPNPYLGHLAWADAFVVTADSVSMLSEACSTAKPVYVVGREWCTGKLAAFHRTLRRRGATRAFTGTENLRETWSYPPLNDNAEAAAKVREALALRSWSIQHQ